VHPLLASHNRDIVRDSLTDIAMAGGPQDLITVGERPPGELLAAISREIVQVFRDAAGKGPTRCKTFFAGPDVVLVLLGGGYTRGEETLYAGGHADEVAAYRRALQESLEERLKAVVEQATGRRVLAFMSANHKEPDMSAELFVLESDV